jgi:hypothetical protein
MSYDLDKFEYAQGLYFAQFSMDINILNPIIANPYRRKNQAYLKTGSSDI